jgi:transcriptional regulator with XRE-family HTH domain
MVALNTTAVIARRVDESRRSSGCSRSYLAEVVGIPRTTLNRKLAGRSDFTIPELSDIGDALGVKPSVWLRGVEGIF